MPNPTLKCPACGSELETLGGPFTFRSRTGDQPEAVRSFDAGYCRTCSRMYNRDRETGEYESAEWAPICHACRLGLQLDIPHSTDDYHLYRCRKHPNEQAAYVPSQDRWFWISKDERQ